MAPLTNFLPYLATIIGVGASLGVLLFAMRSGYSKASGQIQERVISALKEEVESLHRQVDGLEKDRDRQDKILSTVRYALKSRGLKITIEGDFVTLSDSTGKGKVTRIQDRSAALGDDETGVV